MANWTTIDPNTLLPGDPWTSAKAQAAFENLDAFAEGASGAPKLQLYALDDLVAGDVVRWREDYLRQSTRAIGAFGLSLFQQGTVRFSFEHRRASPSLYLNRKRNGVTTTIFSTTSSGGSFVAQTIDVTVVRGDTYTLIVLNDNFNAELRNCRISTTGMRIWSFPYFAWEP